MGNQGIDIPIKIKDKATGELTKIRAGVQRFGADMELTRGNVARLAKAGTVAFAGMAAAGGAALLALTKEVAEIGDEYQKLSKKVGIGAEVLSAYAFAAERSGADIDKLKTGVVKLSNNIADAAAGTGTARLAFQALDIQVKNSDGTLRNNNEILLEVADKFSQLEDGTAKTALAVKIFGRAGAEIIPFLNEGRSGIAELTAQAERLGKVWSQDDAEAGAAFMDAMTNLDTATAGLGKTIGVAVMPKLTEIINETAEWTAANQDFIASGVDEFLEALKTTFDGLVPVVKVFSAGIHTIGFAFDTVGRSIGIAGAAVANLLEGNFKEAWNLANTPPDTAAWEAYVNKINSLFADGFGPSAPAGAEKPKSKSKSPAAPPKTGGKGGGHNASPIIQGLAREDVNKIKAQILTETEQLQAEIYDLTGNWETSLLAQKEKALMTIAAKEQEYGAKGIDLSKEFTAQREAVEKKYTLKLQAERQKRALDEKNALMALNDETTRIRKELGLATIDEVYQAEKAARDARLETELSEIGLSEERKQAIREKYRALDLQAEQEKEAAKREIWIRGAAAIGDVMSGLNSVMGGTNKEIFEMQKAFAIVNATINTYEAATKAMTAAPYPWNYALVAGAIAQGMAQVSAIRNQQPPGYAEGGVVSRHSVIQVAEGNRAEGIVPLSRGRSIPVEFRGGGNERPIQIVNILDPRLFTPDPDAIINIVNTDILKNGVTRTNVKKAAAA